MTKLSVMLRRCVVSLILPCAANGAHAETILFVGSSYTFADHSPVIRYDAAEVHDLNGTGYGGIPALFKTFTREAGLDFDVSHETVSGSALEFHFAEKRSLIDRSWDHVVLQSHSTLNRQKPGETAFFFRAVDQLADMLHTRNPTVKIHLMATMPRADLTYLPAGHWYGKPIQAMADELQRDSEEAERRSPPITDVLPVGESWIRAMKSGVADPNPYDGVEFGKLNLWASDQHHATAYGYYLEALVVFGVVTGRDPLSLGEHERAAEDLGLFPEQAHALQQVAHDELFERHFLENR